MRTHASKTALSLAGLLVTLLGSSEAFAANLLDNATFDQAADGYKGYNPVTSEWKAKDADDVAASGSLLVTNPTIGMNSGAIRCVTSVAAGESYDLAGRILVPSGQTKKGSIGIFITWFAGPGCTGSQLGTGNSTFANITVNDTWQGVRSLAKVAPAGTVSARVYLNVYNDATAVGPLAGYFDDLYFGPSVPAAPPAITSAAPPAGEIGKSYTHTFTASGPPLVTFKASTLPDGLSLTPGGVLAGTPTTKGSFAVDVTASNGVDAPTVQSFVLAIAGPEEDAPEDAGSDPSADASAADAGSVDTGVADASAPPQEKTASSATSSAADAPAEAAPSAPNAAAPTSPSAPAASEDGGCSAVGRAGSALDAIVLALVAALVLARRRR